MEGLKNGEMGMGEEDDDEVPKPAYGAPKPPMDAEEDDRRSARSLLADVGSKEKAAMELLRLWTLPRAPPTSPAAPPPPATPPE